MMIHHLTARVFLMVMDHRADVLEAIRWVIRRLPGNLQGYYVRRISAELLKF